jgi:uncharacterized membrane protein
MAALCFVVTWNRFPVGPGIWFHFGPSVMMLASIVLGPLSGALTGAVGASLVNVIQGTVIQAPAQFIMRFLQCFVCGWIAWGSLRNGKEPKIIRMAVACAIASIAYFALFMAWSYIDLRFITFNNTHEAALVIMGTRVPNSTVMAIGNTIIAAVLAPPLRAALKKARLDFAK